MPTNTAPSTYRDIVDPQPEREPNHSPFETMQVPPRETLSIPETFKSLNNPDIGARPFFPYIPIHTDYGADVTTLPQSAIPHASQDYRLRSNHLAQTLQLFGHKVSEILPEGYSVQIELSPMGGNASGDFIYLIHRGPDGHAQSILERSYFPFDGGGIGWMVPTDAAKNTLLHLEERLFYYKTFLAIKKAIDDRASSAP
jgi:hypothetical protein